MGTCQICLKKFKSLQFQSQRICICGRCTNDLNSYKEVAEESYKAARELLLRGMLRRATLDVSLPDIPLWKQQIAERTLGNLEVEVDLALPKWINRLVADESNRTKIFKIIRANRRGLLHLDRPHRWGYPANWKDVARRIRESDGYACVACSSREGELHVHHIVYASNFGTHQKTNLITLCRACHEKEHERILDFGEDALGASQSFADQLQLSTESAQEICESKIAAVTIKKEPDHELAIKAMEVQAAAENSSNAGIQITPIKKDEDSEPRLVSGQVSMPVTSSYVATPAIPPSPPSLPSSAQQRSGCLGAIAVMFIVVGAALSAGAAWIALVV